MMFRSKAQDGKRMAPRKRTTLRRRSLLEKGMISCLVLIAVSSMLFVSTTLSWFSDQVTAGGTVIQTGEYKVEMVVDDEPIAAGEGGAVVQNAIQMTRVDKESNVWEPGAVFVSDPIYVENTGELELEYQLQLLTANQLENSGLELNENSQQNMSLLNVIDFKIVDAALLDSSAVSVFSAESAGAGSSGDLLEAVDELFEYYRGLTDVRVMDEANLVSSETAADKVFKLSPAGGGSQPAASGVAVFTAENNASQEASRSSSFVIVGRMDPNADISYAGMTLEVPFVLVVKSQQAGFTWAETQTVLCTEESHNQTAQAASAFINTEQGYWKYENGCHVYHCAICQQKLQKEDAQAAVKDHAHIAEQAFKNNGGASVRTTVNGSTVDYYCSVCGERIATASNGTLLILGTGEVVK